MSEQSNEQPGFFSKLKARLNRGRSWLGNDLKTLLTGKVDEDALEQLEDQLLLADVGVEATDEIMTGLRKRLRRGASAQDMVDELQAIITELLEPAAKPLDTGPHRPFVILVVGVNGTGKTTTIGKLSQQLAQDGKRTVLAAADTFRAAAVEQLEVWAKRSGADFIAQHTGADPAAVAFDACQAALARNADVLITDTAGRLHNQAGLMDELKKIARVMAKVDESAPHETLLVLDASQGQNALVQAEQFHAAVGVTGLVLTKLDGTAKGGIVLAIAKRLNLPVRFIGIGEGIEDLQPFDAAQFAKALLHGEAA